MTGRYVYILDAADDLEDDIRHKNFNPFMSYSEQINSTEGRRSFAADIAGMLNLTQHEAANAFELLTMRRFGNIVKNIVYEGLDSSAGAVLTKYRFTAEELKAEKRRRKNEGPV